MDVLKIATFIPVSSEILEDFYHPGVAAWEQAYIRRGLLRGFTADMFGEVWSSAEAELARLERMPLNWDSRVWEDDEDDDYWEDD
jgi:hypothetical protein